MTIEKDKVVTMDFRLQLGDQAGEVLEDTANDKPVTFLFGSGYLIDTLEESLNGLKAGEEFSVQYKDGEAFGTYDEEKIMEMPKEFIRDNEGNEREELLKENTLLPLADEEGNEHQAFIRKVDEKNVTLDFNHPLAGKDVYFSGTVKEVRNATSEELEKGDVQ